MLIEKEHTTRAPECVHTHRHMATYSCINIVIFCQEKNILSGLRTLLFPSFFLDVKRGVGRVVNKTLGLDGMETKRGEEEY